MTKQKTTANLAFAIAGVPCFADTFVQGGSLVLRMKFSAKTPCHRKPPKRQRADIVRLRTSNYAYP